MLRDVLFSKVTDSRVPAGSHCKSSPFDIYMLTEEAGQDRVIRIHVACLLQDKSHFDACPAEVKWSVSVVCVAQLDLME